MTELYCVFYIKSNGFSAQNHAISTLSASNHQISQILWKPSLHIVKNFFKKISAPLQLSQESTEMEHFTFCQRIANLKGTIIRQTDNISCVCFVNRRFALCHKLGRR